MSLSIINGIQVITLLVVNGVSQPDGSVIQTDPDTGITQLFVNGPNGLSNGSTISSTDVIQVSINGKIYPDGSYVTPQGHIYIPNGVDGDGNSLYTDAGLATAPSTTSTSTTKTDTLASTDVSSSSTNSGANRGIYVNKKGSWTRVIAPFINQNLSWTPIVGGWANRNGAWHQFFPSYGIAVWTTPGQSATWTVPPGIESINVTIVGGGGGGGAGTPTGGGVGAHGASFINTISFGLFGGGSSSGTPPDYGGGGGGGGGAVFQQSGIQVTPGDKYAIMVGKGGSGAQAGSGSAGASGGDSSVEGNSGLFIAYGGGGGGGVNAPPISIGGSGGGGAAASNVTAQPGAPGGAQGGNGGAGQGTNFGGGGGGASGNGTDGTPYGNGSGGPGVTVQGVDGQGNPVTVEVGGGGAGGYHGTPTTPGTAVAGGGGGAGSTTQDATTFGGGGGGGGGQSTDVDWVPGSGYSGAVVITWGSVNNSDIPYSSFSGAAGQGGGVTNNTSASGNSAVTEKIVIPISAPPTGFPITFSNGVAGTEIQGSVDGVNYITLGNFDSSANPTFTYNVSSSNLTAGTTIAVTFKFIGTGHITGVYYIQIVAGGQITYYNGGTGGTGTSSSSSSSSSSSGSTTTTTTTTTVITAISESITVPKTAPTTGFNISFSGGKPQTQIQYSLNGAAYLNADINGANKGLFDLQGNYLWSFGVIAAGTYTLQFKFIGSGNISPQYTIVVADDSSLTLTNTTPGAVTIILSNNPPIGNQNTTVTITGLLAKDQIIFNVGGTSGSYSASSTGTATFNLTFPIGGFTFVINIYSDGTLSVLRGTAIITGVGVSAQQSTSGTAQQCTISGSGITFILTPAPGTAPGVGNTTSTTTTPPSLSVTPSYYISDNSGVPKVFTFSASNLDVHNRYLYFFGIADYNAGALWNDAYTDFPLLENPGWLVGGVDGSGKPKVIATNAINNQPITLSDPKYLVLPVTVNSDGTATATLKYNNNNVNAMLAYFNPPDANGYSYIKFTPAIYSIDLLGTSGSLYSIASVATAQLGGFTGETAAERRVYLPGTTGVTVAQPSGTNTNLPTNQSSAGKNLATVSFSAVSTSVAPGGRFLLDYQISGITGQTSPYPLYLTLVQQTAVGSGAFFPSLVQQPSNDVSGLVNIQSYPLVGQTAFNGTPEISEFLVWQENVNIFGNPDLASATSPFKNNLNVWTIQFTSPLHTNTTAKNTYFTQGKIFFDILPTSAAGGFSLTLWNGPATVPSGVPQIAQTTIQCAVTANGSLAQQYPIVAGPNGTYSVDILGWDNTSNSTWAPAPFASIIVRVTLSTIATQDYTSPSVGNNFENNAFVIPLSLTAAGLGTPLIYNVVVQIPKGSYYAFSDPVNDSLGQGQNRFDPSTTLSIMDINTAYDLQNGYTLGTVTPWKQSSIAPQKCTLSVSPTNGAYHSSTSLVATLDQPSPIDYDWTVPYTSTIAGIPNGSVTIHFVKGENASTATTFSTSGATDAYTTGGGSIKFAPTPLQFFASASPNYVINGNGVTFTMSPTTTPPPETATVTVPSLTPTTGWTISFSGWNGPPNTAIFFSADNGATKAQLGNFDNTNSFTYQVPSVSAGSYTITFYADNWVSNPYSITVPQPATTTTVTGTTNNGTTVTGTKVTYSPTFILPESSTVVVNNNWILTINSGPPNTTCSVHVQLNDYNVGFYINADTSGNSPPKSNQNGVVTLSVISQYAGSFTITGSFTDGTAIQSITGTIGAGVEQQTTSTATNSPTTNGTTSSSSSSTPPVTSLPAWYAPISDAWNGGVNPNITSINAVIQLYYLTAYDFTGPPVNATFSQIAVFESLGIIFYDPNANNG